MNSSKRKKPKEKSIALCSFDFVLWTFYFLLFVLDNAGCRKLVMPSYSIFTKKD